MTYIDETEVRKALTLLKPNNEIFEIRIVGNKKQNYSGYFTNIDLMISELKQIDLKGANVYFTINAVEEACYARQQRDKLIQYPKATTSDNDIKEYDYIMIDVDPVRPSDTSSTDEQVELAKGLGNKVYSFLRNIGFEKPMFGYSGNGIHLLYKVALKNNEDNKKLVKKALNTLSMLFDTEDVKVDTTTYNPARICKLYGTLAQKGSNTKKYPHRMSYVIGNQRELIPTDIQYIEKLCSYYPESVEKPQKYNNYNPREFDLEGWLNKYQLGYKTLSFNGGTKYVLDCCPFDSNHKGKDAAIFKMTNGAIGFKCFHNSCQDKKWQDVRLLFEPDAYERNQLYEQKIKYQSFNRNVEQQAQHIEKKESESIFETAIDIYNKPDIPITYVKSGIKMFDELTGGLPKGQCSLLSGLRGSAKSTILNQITLQAINDGNRVGMFSGELKGKRLMSWMFRQAAGKGYVTKSNEYDNYYYVKKEYQKKISEWMGDYFYLYNNVYGNDFGAIMAQFERLVKEKKLDLLILDNLMAFNIKNLDRDKYDAQTEFVMNLHRFAERHNIHVMFVAHPRKAFGFLRLDDISGSADLSNAVDDAFIIHRVNLDFIRNTKQMFGWDDDNELYKCTNVIEICKERDNGQSDKFIPLWFEPETKRLKNSFTENVIYGWNTDTQASNVTSQQMELDPGMFGFEDLSEDNPFDIEV